MGQVWFFFYVANTQLVKKEHRCTVGGGKIASVRILLVRTIILKRWTEPQTPEFCSEVIGVAELIPTTVRPPPACFACPMLCLPCIVYQSSPSHSSRMTPLSLADELSSQMVTNETEVRGERNVLSWFVLMHITYICIEIIGKGYNVHTVYLYTLIQKYMNSTCLPLLLLHWLLQMLLKLFRDQQQTGRCKHILQLELTAY